MDDTLILILFFYKIKYTYIQCIIHIVVNMQSCGTCEITNLQYFSNLRILSTVS